MASEMLCFTIETAAVGRKGRICETAVADLARAMFALCSRYVRSRSHWNGGSEYAQWKAVCGIFLGNAIADAL